MHRRFSSIVKPGRHTQGIYDDSSVDEKSTITSSVAETVKEDLQPPSLKVKRVDHYYSKWYKSWRYRNTSANVSVEIVSGTQTGKDDPWKDCALVVIRKMPKLEHLEPTIKVVLKSPYLIKACKDVVREWPGISWNSDPLEVDPEMLLTFLDAFADYRDNLQAKKATRSLQETYILTTVELLLNTLHTDYHNTIKAVQKLKSHGEITYPLLHAILVPRSVVVTRCAVTGLPRLFKLVSWVRAAVDGSRCYQLSCESVDLVDRQLTQTVGVGKVSTLILIKSFKGIEKIDKLDAYPIRFHSDPVGLREMCLERGKKWLGLMGIHHKEFNGIAALKCGDAKLLRHSVKGRIMIDRATFRRFSPSYKFPVPVATPQDGTQVNQNHHGQQVDDYGNLLPVPPQPLPGSYANGTLVQTKSDEDHTYDDVELDDDDLILSSTVVYGFSLSDKLWLEFDVTKVTDVNWNDEAFANLVLPTDRKQLLQALVEAHRQELGFDDFVKGKGHGLVINLFGPPGVGKTFSAEATSEHVKRPLYLVGAGDLGTDAGTLDLALEKVFEVATAWKAIVLIDEADVFLEQRSLHDMQRNAMVAVFLRHVEYYRGILFLTTNRVKAFDEAFLSRIHVALHFHELPFESRLQVWKAFLAKVGASEIITGEELQKLAGKQVNGRQIKNAARTAQSLAVGLGEKLSFNHFMDTLDAMEDFNKQFEQMTAGLKA